MWDWVSFASGVVGAVLGAGACGLVALVLVRRANQREGRLRAIENINAEARELSRVREDNPPGDGVALQPETVRQMSRATAAVSEFSAILSAKDAPVAAWALGKLVALLNAESATLRFGLVTIINSTLAGWASGRIDTSWFERENRRAAENTPAAGVQAAAENTPEGGNQQTDEEAAPRRGAVAAAASEPAETTISAPRRRGSSAG